MIALDNWTEKWRKFIDEELVGENKLRYLVLFDDEYVIFLRNFKFQRSYWNIIENHMNPAFHLYLLYKKEHGQEVEIELIGRITEENIFYPTGINEFEKKLKMTIANETLYEFGRLLKQFGVCDLINECHADFLRRCSPESISKE